MEKLINSINKKKIRLFKKIITAKTKFYTKKGSNPDGIKFTELFTIRNKKLYLIVEDDFCVNDVSATRPEYSSNNQNIKYIFITKCSDIKLLSIKYIKTVINRNHPGVGYSLKYIMEIDGVRKKVILTPDSKTDYRTYKIKITPQ